jgi:ABC-type proline/glycine betaine transport system ATPase subunit
MKVRINEMSKNDTLIKINQLYKIFGDGQENALELVKNGIG